MHILKSDMCIFQIILMIIGTLTSVRGLLEHNPN